VGGLGADPPTDPDSERALLAAVIVDPSQLNKLADTVCAEDFGDPDLAALFDALQTLHDAGFPVNDARVLVPELKRLNVPRPVTEPAFIASLIADGGVHAYHATYYGQQVRRSAVLRRQQTVGRELLARTANPGADPADIAAWLDSQFSAIGQRVAHPPRQMDAIADEIIEELKNPDLRSRGVMTGLPSHDEAAGGWMPGELVILAARPGIGKTSLGVQIAFHNAMRQRPVLFVSLEMRDRELISRVLCGLSTVNSRRVRAGRLTATDCAAMEKASVQISGVPLHVWAPPTATLLRIRAVAKQQATASGLALLVVDYIGLVQPEDRARPRHEQVAAVSAGLKALAKELTVPVLALCQLNRDVENRKGEPLLSNLRESGAIEQDADIVLFIHRERRDTPQAKLIVAKHRHGDTGAIPLLWVPARTSFEAIEAGDCLEHIEGEL